MDARRGTGGSSSAGSTNRWDDDLEELTRLYRQRLGGLSREEINWKPGPDVWSVGQIVDHVIKTNEAYYPLVEKVRSGEYRMPWIGRFDFVTRFVGALVLKGVEPERRRRMKTFPVFEPTESDLPGDVIQRFVDHQDAFRAFVRECADLVAAGTIVSSPANRYVVYELETAFDIVVSHERRHLNQAEEVLGLLRAS